MTGFSLIDQMKQGLGYKPEAEARKLRDHHTHGKSEDTLYIVFPTLFGVGDAWR